MAATCRPSPAEPGALGERLKDDLLALVGLALAVDAGRVGVGDVAGDDVHPQALGGKRRARDAHAAEETHRAVLPSPLLVCPVCAGSRFPQGGGSRFRRAEVPVRQDCLGQGGHGSCIYGLGVLKNPPKLMELPLIFSLFGALALTLVVPAIRGMSR